MFYRKLTLILFTLLVINLPFLNIKADSPFSHGTNADGGLSYALGVYNAANTEMEKKWRALETLEIEYAMLGVEWRANNEDMVENAKDLGNAVQLDALGSASAVVVAMAKQIVDITDAYNLSVARVNKAIGIEAQNVVVATAVSEQESAHTHYKAHYDAWKEKFSGSKKFIKRGSYPSSVAIGNPGVRCKNPKCTTVYYASTWGLNNYYLSVRGCFVW